MTLNEVINKRKSVRSFKSDDVSDEVLNESIELARKCPSAGATRGYQAIITRERIIYMDAPVYIVICVDSRKYVQRYGSRGENLYAIQDSAVFCSYVQLILVDKGLDSCWVGSFNENNMKRVLNITSKPVAVLAVGYTLDN